MNARLQARTGTAAAAILLVAVSMLVMGVGRVDRATIDESAAGANLPAPTRESRPSVVHEAPAVDHGAGAAHVAVESLDSFTTGSDGRPVAASAPVRRQVSGASAQAQPASASVDAGSNNDTPAGQASTPRSGVKRKTGRAVEASDNAGSFTYAEDGQHTVTSSVRSDDEDPLLFEAYVTPSNDGEGSIRMKITNHNGARLSFPDGLEVVLRVVHQESGEERLVELHDPDITGIADRGWVDVTGMMSLNKFGTYEYSASTVVDYGD